MPARGSAKENQTYCGKDGAPYMFGEPQSPGTRTDVLAVKEDQDNGMPLVDLWENHYAFMIRSHKAAAVYASLRSPVRKWKTKCMLLVGPSNMQKSALATILAPYFGNSTYRIPAKKGSGLYFDGYIGQEVAILDEMDGNRMTPTDFNQLVDEYEHSVPIHGGANTNWCPRVLIITSNYLPRYWWKNRNAAQVFQTTRRIEWTVPRLLPTTPAKLNGLALVMNHV